MFTPRGRRALALARIRLGQLEAERQIEERQLEAAKARAEQAETLLHELGRARRVGLASGTGVSGPSNVDEKRNIIR